MHVVLQIVYRTFLLCKEICGYNSTSIEVRQIILLWTESDLMISTTGGDNFLHKWQSGWLRIHIGIYTYYTGYTPRLDT